MGCERCGREIGHSGSCSDTRLGGLSWQLFAPLPRVRTPEEQRARDEDTAIEVFVMLEAATGLSLLQRSLIVIGVAVACWGWPKEGEDSEC